MTLPIHIWLLDDGTKLAEDAVQWLSQLGADVLRIEEWNSTLICDQLESDLKLLHVAAGRNQTVKGLVLLFVEGGESLSYQWKTVLKEIGVFYKGRSSTELYGIQHLACILFVPHQPEPDSYTFLLSGGDDVIQFPCSRMEWDCRVQHKWLRAMSQYDDPSAIFQIGDLIIDTQARIVSRCTTELQLTTREYELLVILAQHHGRPVSRKFLMTHVWGIDFDTTTNIVDVYIRYLRRKIDKGRSPKLIHTVRGYGYQLKAPTK
ncbi:winged helix-turn-helix domain-containing protein [Paenibacillus taiwanensis]|uniref:winged helix-turn-helix domain-containing protein n=1 Tax=Paenibacillus taiwanensis TaxID=401638 RepID=UPI00068708DD|nr:winged helix-turn-helix domain-containing protein [Paenibacillus taiwanensis]